MQHDRDIVTERIYAAVLIIFGFIFGGAFAFGNFPLEIISLLVIIVCLVGYIVTIEEE